MKEEKQPTTQDISKPSKKEVIEIMQKRGYTLVYVAPGGTTLGFALLKGNNTTISWSVTVLVDKNCFVFNSTVNPGVIKLSTDFFTGVDDDVLFTEIEQYVRDVLTKLYK